MKKIIATKKAPEAIGPYSQGVRAGNLLFVSGQIPYTEDMKSAGEDIKTQTRQSLQNIKAILEEAGATTDNVVKATVYITDMELFEEVNQVYGKFFADRPPARACVEVSRLPKDVKVEIEVIAHL